MPVFQLHREIEFPPVELAEPDGLLAVGGDLGHERILAAYRLGIFPWYSEGSPILWWSPDPRLVLLPEELKVSRSLERLLRKEVFEVTFDAAFHDVVTSCAEVHHGDDGGTWITDEMAEAYTDLHRRGHARSVETWQDGELVGGLYGLAMGDAFFGESMFARRSNASKVAFVQLVRKLAAEGCRLIDCQITTEHLVSFGAREVPREEFLALLEEAVGKES
jgi:leucyl/phenylalanyl-tRNA--protein transferase